MSRIYKHIQRDFYDMVRIWLHEIRQMFKDQGVFIFCIAVPLGYPLLYSFIYTNELVREIPVAVVDNSHSKLSREYLRNLDASPDVYIISYCNDMEEAQMMLKKHKAFGIISMPTDFSRDLARGKQVRVSIFCDMCAMLYYKQILMTNSSVSLAMNDRIKVMLAGNTTDRQDELTTYPLKYKDVALFNPTMGFACFLIPAVLMLILQQTALLGIGLAAGTAREQNRFRELVPVGRRRMGMFRIVLGKSLCYILVYLIVATYGLCLVPRFFNLTQLSQPLTLLYFSLPYILAIIFFAMTVSVFVRNRENSMLIFVFTSVPLLFMSGISWPGSAVPPFWRYVSYIFPSTFGINGFVQINNMGATLQDVAFPYRSLWIQAAVYFMTACLSYRWQIISSLRRYRIFNRKANERREKKLNAQTV